MSDDKKVQQELTAIQAELTSGGLSRRSFLDRLKGIGLGFGAVAAGATAAQAHTGEAVSLKTTNAALGKVLEDSQEAADVEGDENQQQAWHGGPHFRYRRFFYRRFIYRRYARFFYRRFRRRFF